MAIIPSEEINNIRNSANIVDIISSYINLEPRGKNFFGYQCWKFMATFLAVIFGDNKR